VADRPGRGGHGDNAGFAVGWAVDTIAGREEGVEALDEGRVAAEEGRDAINDAGSIDAGGCQLVRAWLNGSV
jgi:hypothetical protein